MQKQAGSSNVVIITIVVIILAAAGVYFLMQNNQQAAPADQADTMMEDDATMSDDAMTDDTMMEDDAMTEDDNMMDDTSTGPDVMIEADGDVMVETDVDVSVDVDLKLTGHNFAFSQDEIRVKQGDTVRIELTSTDGFHDWTVDEFNAQTARVNTGETAVVEFVADKKGTFEYYCSVGSHRALGMKGNLIVE